MTVRYKEKNEGGYLSLTYLATTYSPTADRACVTLYAPIFSRDNQKQNVEGKPMATLEFLGRGFVYSHHLGVPHRLLEVDDKKSFATKEGKPNLNDNLIVQGDNLHALKALMPLYEEQIKCIYIDPPYNTGNEGWAYNDKVNSPLMQDWLGKTVDRDDQCRHDKWLCMMWPRLNLLHDLLSEDGVIFISIDDNEQHRLRAIMDEIFGEKILFQASYGKAGKMLTAEP